MKRHRLKLQQSLASLAEDLLQHMNVYMQLFFTCSSYQMVTETGHTQPGHAKYLPQHRHHSVSIVSVQTGVSSGWAQPG